MKSVRNSSMLLLIAGISVLAGAKFSLAAEINEPQSSASAEEVENAVIAPPFTPPSLPGALPVQSEVEAPSPPLPVLSALGEVEAPSPHPPITPSPPPSVTPSPHPPQQTAQIPLPVIPEQPPASPPRTFDNNNPPPVFNSNSPPPTFDFNNPPPPETFGPQSPIPPTSPAPQNFQFDYNNPFSRYRLGIGDNLSVQVANFPEFNAQGTINIEGNFVVPILGGVPAIGLTLEELSSKISYLLGQRYLYQNPDVTSTLSNPRPATITVMGEVVKPGFYNLVPGAEVDEAIVAAGGSTDWADLRTVVVRRSLADGTVLERQVNIFDSLQNGTRLPPLRLQDGDSVFVAKVEVGSIQDYDRSLVSRSTVAQQQIVINVLSYANEAIGSLTLRNGSTFVDALAQLGLSFENADLDSIGLLRFDPEQGKVVSQSLNALSAIEGDISQDIPLQDGDIFVVRRSTFAKIDYVLRTITRPINSVTNLFNFIRDSLINTIPNLFRSNPNQR
ncbi:polysaccharide biosynthesis/export family protein [Oscillatoria sp. FACHB-1406]|uniref:polysaccharide biosynthesis/export family protein n=1 Tax=Oscillatoria sp. FACHB-1406 TaxID=2692846 RepID=UPI001684EFCC|nr:polysaccharide biosynthesis/export family protein [Oscillatoria sp. FACHB-1406]MBD2578981.1 SLBB domain-containing protein [Oscillatoria sp. FACHB-1406]